MSISLIHVFRFFTSSRRLLVGKAMRSLDGGSVVHGLGIRGMHGVGPVTYDDYHIPHVR